MSTYYHITVDGHLGERWSEWFDGLTITNEADGTTVLAGLIIDQVALHGVLVKIRDLGLSLIALRAVRPDEINDHIEENGARVSYDEPASRPPPQSAG